MSKEVVAEEKTSLGKLGRANFSFKIDYLKFTDDFFSGSEDTCVYYSFEGYWNITDNFYLGGEAGKGEITHLFIRYYEDEISYKSIELNAKYAIALNPRFLFDFGGGASYNRAEIKIAGSWDYSKEWLWGGQLFMGLTWKLNRFSIGLNGKYQITEDHNGTNSDFSNHRWGLAIGKYF